MKFFIDTADLAELKALNETGLVDGVTTNPSLVAKTGMSFIELITEICSFIKGPVSAEVVAQDCETMVKEGLKLAKIADNVVIKVPLTMEGLKACRAFRAQHIGVNVTLCFSAPQALLAAKAGASYISPFIGRLDDIGQNGMQLIEEIVLMYENYPEFDTQVLAASIRHPQHVLEASQIGAHVATLPPAIFRTLFNHPLTDKGLDLFIKDWQKTGQSIL